MSEIRGADCPIYKGAAGIICIIGTNTGNTANTIVLPVECYVRCLHNTSRLLAIQPQVSEAPISSWTQILVLIILVIDNTVKHNKPLITLGNKIYF